MKIKMKTLAAGPSGVKEPGKVYDVDAKEAKAFIDGGYADSAEPQKPPKEPKQPKEPAEPVDPRQPDQPKVPVEPKSPDEPKLLDGQKENVEK